MTNNDKLSSGAPDSVLHATGQARNNLTNLAERHGLAIYTDGSMKLLVLASGGQVEMPLREAPASVVQAQVEKFQRAAEMHGFQGVVERGGTTLLTNGAKSVSEPIVHLDRLPDIVKTAPHLAERMDFKWAGVAAVQRPAATTVGSPELWPASDHERLATPAEKARAKAWFSADPSAATVKDPKLPTPIGRAASRGAGGLPILGALPALVGAVLSLLPEKAKAHPAIQEIQDISGALGGALPTYSSYSGRIIDVLNTSINRNKAIMPDVVSDVVARLHGGAVRLEDNSPGLRVILALPARPAALEESRAHRLEAAP